MKQRTVERGCQFCGKAFRTLYATHCSKTCAMKSWRAVVMLAGTHAYVGRKFKRIAADDLPPMRGAAA